jgi:hypothetical protein
VIDLPSDSKKIRIVSKTSLKLVDWMLAIDFDVSQFPAWVDFLLEETRKFE